MAEQQSEQTHVLFEQVIQQQVVATVGRLTTFHQPFDLLGFFNVALETRYSRLLIIYLFWREVRLAAFLPKSCVRESR